jgi:hypothetical protein
MRLFMRCCLGVMMLEWKCPFSNTRHQVEPPPNALARFSRACSHDTNVVDNISKAAVGRVLLGAGCGLR